MQQLFPATLRMELRRAIRQPRRFAISGLLVLATVAVAVAAFLLHVNLSTAGSLELFIVLLVTLRFDLFQATIVSVAAFFCLNFLFTAPVFTFSVTDPQNWVSLVIFEVTALLVSGLSSQVRMHAEQAEQQRASAVRLYDLSRAVLLIDQLQSTADQLAQVIREVLQVGEVEIWAPAEDGSMAGETYLSSATTPAERAYLAGHEYDDFANATSCRLLKRGTSITGSITLSSWDIDPLTADAVASLAAIAFERARAVERETHAKLERDAEKLRTAVLDGLAHSFKTPLTAIQTASSGLLALDGLDATQAELVGIIDERATMLNRLTTRLLQTAALEAKQIRLRRTNASMLQLVRKVLGELDEETRARTSISLLGDVADDQMDATLVELALQQLMDNAAKYSTIGSPIEITVNQRESATVVVIENIRDAGSTIRPEERFKIFDRFYRGLDALHGPPGTGLGLSIVKKTAEAHGGHVRLECPDGMTRFVFSICRHSDAEVAHGC